MSKLPVHTCARDYVCSWLEQNHEELGLKQIKMDRIEHPARSLNAWYETPHYLIDICVWDRAYCLDILVVEKSSDSMVFGAAGSCESTAGLLERLTSFASWASSKADWVK